MPHIYTITGNKSSRSTACAPKVMWVAWPGYVESSCKTSRHTPIRTVTTHFSLCSSLRHPSSIHYLSALSSRRTHCLPYGSTIANALHIRITNKETHLRIVPGSSEVSGIMITRNRKNPQQGIRNIGKMISGCAHSKATKLEVKAYRSVRRPPSRKRS